MVPLVEMTILLLELNWLVVWVSTVALLGWLYIGDAELSSERAND